MDRPVLAPVPDVGGVSLAGVALALVVAAGVDDNWNWMGQRGSTLRRVVVLSSSVAGLVGAGMFAGALHRFAAGDPESQYDSRLSRGWRRVFRRRDNY